MKKLILLLSVLLFSCSAEETEQATLNIPERYWGNFGTENRRVSIESNRITIKTPDETLTRSNGSTTLDNNNTHYEAKLLNNEKLILLLNVGDVSTESDDIVGVALFKNDVAIVSEHYMRE